MTKDYSFFHEDGIQKIQRILEEIGDNCTVIMGPKRGNSKEPPETKMRVYSHGGNILNLSTEENKKCVYIPDKEYLGYNYESKPEPFPPGPMDYDKFDDDKLRSGLEFAIELADNWANGGKHHRKERSVETALICKNRKQEEPSALLIDMEFTCPECWLKEGGESKTAKPDLVVYDMEEHSFGIVELKYDGKSLDNLEKHLKDFTNMVESDHADDIKQEFVRRMKYLEHYGLIDSIDHKDLECALENPIWMAFLFVGGVQEEIERKYNNTLKSCGVTNQKTLGYQYYLSSEQEMDFSRKAFFPDRP